MKSRLLSQDKNLHLLLPFIGSSWYKKKISKKIPPPHNQKPSKNAQEIYDKNKRNIQTVNQNLNKWRFLDKLEHARVS